MFVLADFYEGAKFHACIKKCTIHLKFGAKKRIKVKTMSENIAGACVCNMRIEFNLRRNVQLYSFRMF